MCGALWRTIGAVGVLLGATVCTARADPPALPVPVPAPAAAAPAAAPSEPPAGFERFFDRGHIPGLDHPVYVSAAEARLPPDTWVIGVVVEGQPLAYEVNLLTRSEVVNDAVGGRPFAVVWCPLANSVGVYDRRVAGRELHFEPSGVLMHGSIVMQDRETESYWPLLHEKSMYGPLVGAALTRVPGVTKARWADWRRDHPDTRVWSLNGQQALGGNPMMRYQASSYGYRGMDTPDKRLPAKETVFGFARGGRVYAAAAPDVEGGRALRVGDEWVFLHRPRGANLDDPTSAFVSKAAFSRQGDTWVDEGTGARFDVVRGVFVGERRPERLEGFDAFWYVWSLNFPGTELLGRP